MLTAGDLPPLAPSGISRISVTHLFGYLSYDLPVHRPKSAKDPSILILYGDNGTGKTTLLRLLVNVLSPVDNAGHKSFVSRTAFQKFIVHFESGVVVTAMRHAPTAIGTFVMTIENQGVLIAEAEFAASKDLSIRPEAQRPSDDIARFLKTLSQLNLGLFFLSDDRLITSNLFRVERRTRDSLVTEWERLKSHSFDASLTREQVEKDRLEEAVERAVDWVQQQVLRGSTRGELDTNNIYTDIVRRLASTRPRTGGRATSTVRVWERKLKELARRSEMFAALGLTSPISTSEILNALRTATKPALPLLERVLEPYIDGMRARLDALEDVRKVLEVLLNVLNDFYSGKRVKFDLHAGFRVVGFGNQTLPLSLLSSGERQLLLLFCNVLLARGQRTVFIVDEPELSLNVKWQRLLIHALAACVQGSETQFIFASHSLELIARHTDSVARLRSTAKAGWRYLDDAQQENA